MRALNTHLAIIAVLCAVGLALWAGETVSDAPGGLFPRYAITKILWLGIAIYAGVSTSLVLMVGWTLRLMGRAYSVLGVLLTHAAPVAVVILMLSFGVHDSIQDILRDRPLPDIEAMPAPPPGERPAPPTAPMKGRLPQAPSNTDPAVIPDHADDTVPSGSESQ